MILRCFWICCFALLAKTAYPDSIQIDSVSVLGVNEGIIIGWSLQTSIQEGYTEIHRRLDTGNYALIGQVPLHQTSFSDYGVNPELQAYSYYIVAREPDGTNIAVGLEAHQNAFLFQPQPNVCEQNALVRWSNYQLSESFGAGNPLPDEWDEIQVLMGGDIGDLQLVFVASNEGGQQQEATVGIGNDEYLCAQLRVRHSSGHTASSNSQCFHINQPPIPDSLFITKASVNDNQGSEISFYTSQLYDTNQFVLMHAQSENGTYSALDNLVLETKESTYFHQWEDFSSPQYYYIQLLDSCSNPVLRSQTVNTLYLDVVHYDFQGANLEWTPYFDWDNQEYQLEILRKLPQEQNYQTIYTTGPNQTQYEDHLADEMSVLGGATKYKLMLYQSIENALGRRDTIFSNTAYVLREIDVFIPNAIKLSSEINENRYFKPRFSFFTPSHYSLSIFNRWGERIFYTNDFDQPWNGEFRGNSAPAGTYSYIIEFEDSAGEKQIKKGVLLLLK